MARFASNRRLLIQSCPVAKRRFTGFTLVEALIAVTMTLIIMLALATAFKRLSDDISQGRARLALSDQLRGISEILRSDLAGLTVSGDPNSSATKSGYLLYYDGPLNDHTAVTAPINNRLGITDAKLEENLSTSKYGDFDDILMFTARANGDWFKGRVPLAIVKGAAGATVAAEDWGKSVVVASEYAEIAYFMVPMTTTSDLPSVDYTVDANNVPLFDDNDTAVNVSTTTNQFTIGTTTTTDTLISATTLKGNAIPDRMALCRRVLLILPTLNVTSGGPQLFTDGTANSLDTDDFQTNSETFMWRAYQRCDLSVHRKPSPTNSRSPIVANSLEDLAHPFNRFAHTVKYISGVNTTLPHLSLTAPISLQRYSVSASDTNIATSPSGFIPSVFLRRKFFFDGTAVVSGDVSNSEVLAVNCVAFDLKGFDPTARLLFHTGVDGTAGGSSSTLGESGSDDLVLSPSDPGYGSVMQSLSGSSPPYTLSQVTASIGTFVDAGWAFKKEIPYNVANAVEIYRSTLSGTNSETMIPLTSLFKSGRFHTNGTVYDIFQPCFDTFTSAFEHDGFAQAGGGQNSTFFGGMDWLQGNAAATASATNADKALNGLDDNGDGQVDDQANEMRPLLSSLACRLSRQSFV